MISKYEVFCQVIQNGSFTKAAHKLGYTQSSVSQIIKQMETEFGTVLIERRKDGINLTSDGQQYYPYFQGVVAAERAVRQKKNEMDGMLNSEIRIGTFTSVSRNYLPTWMKKFQMLHPNVTFFLKQGDYSSIQQWINDGSVDCGFVSKQSAETVEFQTLYTDRIAAVLPPGHPLADKDIVTLEELSKEHLILMDEGNFNVSIEAFSAHGLVPNIKYRIYDDNTILAMIRQGFGISMLYENVLQGFDHGLITRPIQTPPTRDIAIAWRNWDTISYAAKEFIKEVIDEHIDFLPV